MSPPRFLPYRQIAVDIASRLAAGRRETDPLAPWSEEVIVPSRGVAESIATELLALLPAGVAGIRLHSLENLAQRMVNEAGEFPRVAPPEERRLAMRTTVRSLDDPLTESRGIAAMLERTYRDVRDSGTTLAELAQRIGGERRLRNPRRTGSILRVWQEYERLIAKMNAIDPADLLRRATQLAGPSMPRQLLAGFYDMTGAQLALLHALVDAGRVADIWVPTGQPFARRFFESVGGVAPPTALPAGKSTFVTPVPAALTRYETRVEEVEGLCARVGMSLAGGTAPAGIGIVARSLEPYDIRLLNRFAAKHGFRTSLTEMLPLRAHRIGRGATMLLKLRDRGFPRSDVLELVRDGLRTRIRLDIDSIDAATRRARIAGGTSEELKRITSRSRAIDDYIMLVTELEELTSVSELLPRMGSIFRIETELDLAAAGALDDIAALFRRASIWNRPLDVPSILDAIEQATLSLRPDIQPSPLPLVWAGDVMRFRGRSFAELFAMRMEDDVFPQRRLEDPLLPDHDRLRLGIREIGDGAAEESLLFSLLGDATSTAIEFSHAEGDGFGKVLRGSRFVRSFDARNGDTGAPVSGAPSRRQLQHLVKRARYGAFDGIVGPLGPEIEARLESLSPTQLEDFGECPQKFFLKHVLGAVDIDRPERELQINHREKGTIDHRILERFYRAISEEEIGAAAAALPQLPPTLVQRLELLIDQQFDEHESTIPPFNPTVRAIERRATKRILRDFVVRDLAELTASGLRPQFFEYRFGARYRDTADHPEPFVIRAAGSAVRVEGTIDRIDGDGSRFRIIDYKSGKALRHEQLGDKIDRGIRLQLALYAMAVSEFFGAAATSVSGAIRPIATGDSRKFSFELAEKNERLLETLDIFLTAIHDGMFPAFPDEGSCKYCPVNHACRTKHDLEERNEVQRHGDPRTLMGGSA